jgi:hypothetical protein
VEIGDSRIGDWELPIDGLPIFGLAPISNRQSVNHQFPIANP